MCACVHTHIHIHTGTQSHTYNYLSQFYEEIEKATSKTETAKLNILNID